MTQQFRYVGGHIEVFSESGVFLFSVEYIQRTFVTLYKLQLAKASFFAYNKDRKREAESLPIHTALH